MGGKSSKPADGKVEAIAPSGYNAIVTHDGKQAIVGTGSIEDQIIKSFEAGKQEGLVSIHRSLDSVAAQVYDNVHEQLVEMQGQQLEKASEKARIVKVELVAAAMPKTLCEDERALLISCLKFGHKSPLLCNELVLSFEKCSFASTMN